MILPPEELPNFSVVPIPRGTRNYVTGVVRGKIHEDIHDSELWCSTRDVLDRVHADCGANYGLGVLLSMVRNDNKGRFELKVDKNHPNQSGGPQPPSPNRLKTERLSPKLLNPKP